MTKNSITCPNCGTDIDIDEIFYKQIEEQFKKKHLQEQKKFKDELERKRKEYKAHLDELNKKEKQLKEQEEKFQEELQKATKEKLLKEKAKLQQELKEQLKKEQEASMELLKKELSEKSKELLEFNKLKIQMEQLKREKEEVASKAKLEAQIELNKRLNEEKLKLKKSVEDEIALKLRQKDEQIEQMKRDIENAKRKAEQASMQTQGEALELAIEEWLKSQFPFDNIEEVKKGAFGADCIQTVHTRELQNCGIICYESKNTKSWSDGWIAKLKQDMLKVGADIGVLVTSVYPQGMDKMGFVDGIWVCNLSEFKGSVSLLRESLIRVQKIVKREENKSDKMTLLYNYLTGNEFAMQLKAIVDGFMSMQRELEKEKRSLMASWKRRQKLIDNVLQNTTQMYGSLQGIAGSGALGHIDALELDTDDMED